jgi:uncharacterized repeat protein (TIGR02543 family)
VAGSAQAQVCTLAVSSTQGGSVTVPGEGVFPYPFNSAVPIQAVADPGYKFVGWTGTAVQYNQVADPHAAQTVVNLTIHNKTVSANFELVCTDEITLTTSSTKGGSVALPGEGAFVVPCGTIVPVEAEAETCYAFTHWTGTAVTLGRIADPNASSTEVTLWEDLTLIANFEYVCPDPVLKVKTEQPEGLTCMSAVLRGRIWMDGGDPECRVRFRYFKLSDTFVHGTYTPEQVVHAVDGVVGFSYRLEGLEPGTQYGYQAVAENSVGYSIGQYVYFTTPECACAPMVLLTVSAGCGGQVPIPGPGTHVYGSGSLVTIEAVAYPGYAFLRWEGTAVDTDRVADPNAAETTVLVDANYTVRACFISVAGEVPKVIYVDDDAVSNCLQDGSRAHPYGQVQVGILMARQGDTVVVLPGTYYENLNFRGKSIRLMSLAVAEPDTPEALGAIANTVLHGNYAGSVVVFSCGEDPNTLLAGFTLAGGRARSGGAIQLYRSSPTISNCVITGNRSTRGTGGAVDCTQSESVFLNCTFSGNYAGCEGAAVASEDSSLSFINCILWGNLPDQIAVLSGPQPVVEYCDVQDTLWPGPGNISEDPLFARSGVWASPVSPHLPVDAQVWDVIWLDGDYHVRSTSGRYDPVLAQWLLDLASSPCIDLGHPQSDALWETAPNGDRINMGAYGGTRDASRSD